MDTSTAVPGAATVSAAEVRLHGRGGQGVVTAAALLALAAFLDGRAALAFPSFGSERMGAPVEAYVRVSDAAITVREPVLTPDLVVVLDATLLHHVDVFAGLRASGAVLINSARSVGELGLDDLSARLLPGHVVSVPATQLAREYVGSAVPNVVMLGALAALTHVVRRSSLHAAVRRRFPTAVAEANLRAADAAAGTLAASVAGGQQEVIHA